MKLSFLLFVSLFVCLFVCLLRCAVASLPEWAVCGLLSHSIYMHNTAYDLDDIKCNVDYSSSNSSEKKSTTPATACSLPSAPSSLLTHSFSPSLAPSASSTSSFRLPATSVVAMT